MHEIITLQLGQRANYLATHFWNLQESYFTYGNEGESPIDHDVHFRPGVGADGNETYTPRTLIYDLKGGFGTLRKYNALYELSEDLTPGHGLWDGKEVIQQQAVIPLSDYQKNLDEGLPAPPLSPETVRYWSDYNRLFYHPRSIVQLNDYELNSRTMPFEDWSVGEDLFNDLDKEHDLLDRDARPFAEECDQLRALQIFTGSDDAWGGFSSKYVDRLRDEYGKKAIWVWAIEGVSKQVQHKRDMNKARTICNISPQSSLYTPIKDPLSHVPSSIHFYPHSQWQSSALICSAVETATLPSRLRPYHDFESSLAGDDGIHNIFELQSTIISSEAKEDELSKVQKEYDLDFTYDSPKGNKSHIFNQVQVRRGVDDAREGDSSGKDLSMLRRERAFNSEPSIQSFPRDMFPVTEPEGKINVLATLTASSRTAEEIKGMETGAGRIIGIDERETIVNGLGDIRETYETGWTSDLEFDDD
ncbi:misato family protein [Aspergillus tanneri]|uniref:Protein DML1 n=1 Tax=Aspergillus tanneri TaxID=1220188 RepID=A0A5M9MWQ7_9EURO|nr:mtDNA inheritance, partitioning of the mitochondrial organelle [Aspergillus tanneri]KAA8651562.1 mtDNA inheritance, partitioning of the mitochondrial organelle [Aspergillus tanneri]